MSSKFTQDLKTMDSGKDQEKNQKKNLKMRKRSSNNSTEASQRIQGGNIMTQSTDPSNNIQEEVSKRQGGKRKASSDARTSGHKKRCCVIATTAPSPVTLGKRKADDGAETPNKRGRWSNSNTVEPDPRSEEEAHLVTEKREVTDDDNAPQNRLRCSSNSNKAESPGAETSDDISLEEKIFELASPQNSNRAEFESKYTAHDLIGAGGFGFVYKGLRNADGIPVAIKHIPREGVLFQVVTCNGKMYSVIQEVAFMLKAAGLPGSGGNSAAVSLLDWYLLEDELILVMEKPDICQDLYQYRKDNGGSLDEDKAKMILRQLVDAAIDMENKGIFHRDIKLRNVLVHTEPDSPDTPRVRLIDFGCSIKSQEEAYHSYCGTLAFAPPEWYDYQQYWAQSTTVWQLGALFYQLLKGHGYFSIEAFLGNGFHINKALSTHSKSLLLMCLTRSRKERITLKDLQQALR